MASKINIGNDLQDLLLTKNFDPKITNKFGQETEPNDGTTFSFDYVSSNGKNYGTAVIVLGDSGDLMLFFGDNLGRSMENPEDKSEWFEFMRQLKDFSVRHNFQTFTPKNLNQIKHTLAGIAAIKEGLFEGYYGTRKISYAGQPTEARLMIRHSQNLGENDARYRHVESLFIETVDGERFKLPFRSLAGGRAMLEHVRQGGKPYDVRGCHIAEMVSEIAVLSRFNRASSQRILEGSTQQLVTEAQAYYKKLKESLKHLGSSRGYNNYFESWHPATIDEHQGLVEDIKTMFVEQTIDSRIEAALPVLAKIQQGSTMKEADIFESWINNLAEGTWALPDTPESKQKLADLLASELQVGPDATNATEQLYDIFGDDQLFDQLEALAQEDANADARPVIIDRLKEIGIEIPGMEPTEEPAAEMPTDDDAVDIDQQQGVAEGYQLDEGAVETITALVKKIPGIGKYYQMAQQYKSQLIDILKTSKSGQEVKQKMEQLVSQSSTPVAEAGVLKQLGGLAAGGGSILTTVWMNAMGLIDGVLARAAAGEVGGAAAAGAYLGLIPTMMMVMAVMLLFKGSSEQSAAKAQKFQAQRSGVAEGTEELEEALNKILKLAQVPVAEARIIDESGETLDHILDRFKYEVQQFEQGGDLDDNLYDALFDYYANSGEMPYGTMKARTGDPYEWITQKLDQELGLNEADNIATFEGDTEDAIAAFLNRGGEIQRGKYHKPRKSEKTDYGSKHIGTLGGAGKPGKMSGTAANVGGTGKPVVTAEESSCNHTMEGEYCPEHGLMECGSYMESMGGTVAGAVAPVMDDSTDSMDHRGAVTDSFYEDLDRLKKLALVKKT